MDPKIFRLSKYSSRYTYASKVGIGLRIGMTWASSPGEGNWIRLNRKYVFDDQSLIFTLIFWRSSWYDL